jgi:hypothetical protein
LKPASNLLDDVEGFFLAPEVMQHPPRSEQQMAEWLGHAANVLPLGGNEALIRSENELRNSCPVFGWTWIGSRFSVWDKPKQRLHVSYPTWFGADAI